MSMMNNKILLWLPRLLSIALVGLLSLFSLDVFEQQSVWYLLLLGFFIHNIPVVLLVIIICLSWKKPFIGAVAFTLSGALYSVYMLIQNGLSSWTAILTLGLPSIIVGVLYYVSYRVVGKS